MDLLRLVVVLVRLAGVHDQVRCGPRALYFDAKRQQFCTTIATWDCVDRESAYVTLWAELHISDCGKHH